jgi:hypothetical protein
MSNTPRYDEKEQQVIAAEFTYGMDSKGKITIDDHCYVVWHSGPEWKRATWLFREAVAALKTLPDNPEDITDPLFAEYRKRKLS